MVKAASSTQLNIFLMKFRFRKHNFMLWVECILGQEEDSEAIIMGLECVERLILEVWINSDGFDSVLAEMSTCQIMTCI